MKSGFCGILSIRTRARARARIRGRSRAEVGGLEAGAGIGLRLAVGLGVEGTVRSMGRAWGPGWGRSDDHPSSSPRPTRPRHPHLHTDRRTCCGVLGHMEPNPY